MKLRNKIFITFACIILILLSTVGIVVHEIFSSSTSQEVVIKTEKTIIQLNYNLEMIIEDASRSTLSLLYNKDLVDILREYDKDKAVNYTMSSEVKLFSLFLSSITFNKDQIYGIHIFLPNGQMFSHMDSNKLRNFINLEDQDWYLKAKRQEGGWITYYDKAPIYYKNNNKEYLSFLRLLRDPDNQKELGVIRIDFSPSYISEIIDQFSNEYLQITNINNEPLLGEQADDLFSSCHSNNSWVKDEKNGKEYICVTHTSNKTGFKISNLISKDHLYKDVREFDRFIYSLIGVCLLFSLLISYYMAIYLLRPLYLLKSRIQFFQTKSQSSPQSMDEFAELEVAYDGMLSEIDYLVEEVYEITKQNAEAEFKALQSQMDPHFIFNTLESINMKAISNDQYELSDMIVELGKLIRFRLRNEEQQILLGEEITFTKTYVNIMKNRLEDALEVDWDVEDEVLDFPVPKYIIQPLIENSIMHGYGDNIQSLKVLITIRRDQQTLKLTVKDNGSGITGERLLKIEEALHGFHLPKVEETKTKNNRGSIALVNINRRLQLIYGINSRLHISSITGIGTMVDIEINK